MGTESRDSLNYKLALIELVSQFNDGRLTRKLMIENSFIHGSLETVGFSESGRIRRTL